MSDYTNTPHEIGWDDEISNESSYILLEEGDYDFTVTAFERGRFPGSTKIPACNKAMLTLKVDTAEGPVFIKYDLIMYSTLEWKLHDFFCAIGQKKRGEPLRPRWNEVVGSRGRAHIKPRTYTKKDGSGKEVEVNDVDKFYDYDPAAVQPGPARQQSMWKPDTTPSPTPWETGKF